MTLIILTVLAAAWLGYFALWYRDRRASRLVPNGGMVGFNRSGDGLGLGVAPDGSAADGGSALGDLLDTPRTRYQAWRRRRQVAVVLGAVAAASLLATPVLGPGALTVHVLADVVLVLFALSSVSRQQARAASLAEVRVLYPDRASDTVAMPLERAATG